MSITNRHQNYVEIYHIINKLLNGIMIANVNLVKVDRQVNILPHIMIMFHMVIKTISMPFKFIALKAADKAQI